MSKPVVFSGIQPSGTLHLGNYLGAILPWIRHQGERQNIFSIVDLHAITVPQDPDVLRKNIYDTTKIYLAAGIDPKKSLIFLQSDVHQHSELAWILNNYTYFGEMSRMTQFKDKSKRNIFVTLGLFDYPVLMAADILLYQAHEVPVGDDQKQHVEIARDIAERFNNRYKKKIFTIPKPLIEKEAARIMSLTDPTAKMAKSDDNDHSRINLTDSPEVIRKKISRAVTDSDSEIIFDQTKKPGISNLLNILSTIKKKPIKGLERQYAKTSYGDFKADVAEAIVDLLLPLHKKFEQISDSEIKDVLADGKKQASPIAAKTLAEVKEIIGLGPIKNN